MILLIMLIFKEKFRYIRLQKRHKNYKTENKNAESIALSANVA